MSDDVSVSALLEEVVRALPANPGESTLDAARTLIASVLDRSWSAIRLAERDQTPLAAVDVERVRTAARRLRSGMPMAYAVGSAAFRHLVLHVDERVLIPRPETELLIDHALRLMHDRPGGLAVDVGTGSGAIALALAQEGAFERVIGTDISADALAVARLNGERVASMLRAPVEWRLGADLTPVQGLSLRLIVSNPPYIAYSEADALPSAVRDWEPPTALFAADNGMARYAELLQRAPSLLEPGGWIVLECDARRAAQTAALAERVGAYDGIRVYDDLAGRARVLVAQRRMPSPPDAI
jgi:release factor glutamine methyltransferase